MSFPITLAVTTGRSGSTFLADSFRLSAGDRGHFFHELLHPGISRPADLLWHTAAGDFDAVLEAPELQRLLQGFERRSQTGPVVDFGFTLTGLIPLFAHRFGERFKVLVLHRHPVSVAGSFAIRGHYTRYRNPAWAISPLHPNARFRSYASRWGHYSRFEKCLYRWLEITAYGSELPRLLPQVPVLEVASSELFSDPGVLRRIATFVGLNHVEIVPSSRTNPSEQQYLERWPVGQEWRRFFDFPEVLALAGKLGYDCSPDSVERLVAPYALPRGLGPRLRHDLGYWEWRERLGKWREALTSRSKRASGFREEF